MTFWKEASDQVVSRALEDLTEKLVDRYPHAPDEYLQEAAQALLCNALVDLVMERIDKV